MEVTKGQMGHDVKKTMNMGNFLINLVVQSRTSIGSLQEGSRGSSFFLMGKIRIYLNIDLSDQNSKYRSTKQCVG